MSRRPRALVLFCGAGGCSVGYGRAGYDVTGNDLYYHRDYPFPMLVDNALHVLEDRAFLDLFDLIHAGPPCQDVGRLVALRDAQGGSVRPDAVNMIPEVRQALDTWGGPYVLENVPPKKGRETVRPDVILCGSMFGLKVRRHRWFEFGGGLQAPMTPECLHDLQGRPIGVYGSPADDIPKGGRTARTLAEAGEAMGAPWITRWADMVEAIPPAYTEYLGAHLLTTPIP